MTDTVSAANYRTRLEAELAGRFLEGAGIPYVINSPEGMLHGPLGTGAMVLVRSADLDLAREILRGGDDDGGRPGATRVAVLPDGPDDTGVVDRLRDAGVPTLVRPNGAQLEVWVRREHADRAHRALGGRLREGA